MAFFVPPQLIHSNVSASLLGLMIDQGESHIPRLAWLVSALIVVLGLGVYGLKDLIRTSWTRIWAISGICQTEALRKRVLWVTPLAILGVVVVSQFQQSSDPADSIRQTTKFCLFASALLVTVTAVILACTNLPREIESRVIFTIVTKPTTRLEILLGKALGFARISALIILIMGGFTLAYLELRTRPMLDRLKAQVASLSADSPLLASDEYYIHSGLLGTRSLQWPDDAQFYSRIPDKSGQRWTLGGVGQYVLAPYDLTKDQKEVLSVAAAENAPVLIQANVGVNFLTPTAAQLKQVEEMNLVDRPVTPREPAGPAWPIPAATTAPTTAPSSERHTPFIAALGVRFLDADLRPIAAAGDSRDMGMPIVLKPTPDGKSYQGAVAIDSDLLQRLSAFGRFWLQVNGRTPATEFAIAPRSLSLVASWPITTDEGKFVSPKEAALRPAGSAVLFPPIFIAKDPADPTQDAQPLFHCFPARRGMRLNAALRPGGGPVAVFDFHNTPVSAGPDGKVALQIDVSVEGVGNFVEDSTHAAGYSDAEVEVINRKTGEDSGPIRFSPETSRTIPVSVDKRFFEGGDFSAVLRNTTLNQSLGIMGARNGSIAVISADRSFVFNLIKSLFVLWLLSILVVVIALFCSTFLSWPIAVVLTLLILLGHWGVNQLGDSLKAGVAGRSVVTTAGIRDPGLSEVVSTGVEDLSSMLRFVSNFLPDVDQFAVSEDIERGISLPPAKIGRALAVLFCYGVPLLVFSYVILKRKEVAP